MGEYMAFWFAKIATEFLTGLAIVLGIALLFFLALILEVAVFGPIRLSREMKYWQQQTPQWRRNKLNSMNDSFSPENWPKKWQQDMVDKDNREYR